MGHETDVRERAAPLGEIACRDERLALDDAEATSRCVTETAFHPVGVTTRAAQAVDERLVVIRQFPHGVVVRDDVCPVRVVVARRPQHASGTAGESRGAVAREQTERVSPRAANARLDLRTHCGWREHQQRRVEAEEVQAPVRGELRTSSDHVHTRLVEQRTLAPERVGPEVLDDVPPSRVDHRCALRSQAIAA
jgi:hypothetical protein